MIDEFAYACYFLKYLYDFTIHFIITTTVIIITALFLCFNTY